MESHHHNYKSSRCVPSELRKILKISWRDKIRNDEVLSRAESRNLSDMVVKRRIQLTSHILHLPEIRPAKIVINWIPYGAKRQTRGKPKTCRATDLQQRRPNWHQVPKIAQDRFKWNQIVARCCTAAGGSW